MSIGVILELLQINLQSDDEGASYRAVGEAVENGADEDHIKLLVDKNREKQNKLEDIQLQMAKHAFYHFVVYIYYKMDLLDTTELSKKQEVLEN